MRLTTAQEKTIGLLLGRYSLESLAATISGIELPDRGSVIVHVRDQWSSEHYVIDRGGKWGAPGWMGD